MSRVAEPGLRLDFQMAGRGADDTWLREETADVVSTVLGALGRERVCAIVVAGSLARGEGGVLWKDEKPHRVVSDLDLYVVAAREAEVGLLRGARLEHLESLARGPLPADVGITTTATLADLPPTIANLSLVEEGRVVWGDAKVLTGVRRVDAAAIPREDALNLVLNRAAEELIARAAARLAPGDAAAAAGVFLRGIKTVADLGLAILLSRGAPSPSYRGRGERVAAAIAADARLARCVPAPFGDAVERAARWKLAPEWGALEGHVPGTDGFPERVRRWQSERILAMRGFLGWYADESDDVVGALSRSEPLLRAARAWARSARGSFAAARRAVWRVATGRVRPSPRLDAQVRALALYLASDDASGSAPAREVEEAVLNAWGREIMGWGKA